MELFSAFICANNIGSFVNGLFGVKTFNAFLSLSPFDNDVDGTTSMQILVLGLFTPWDIFGLESIIRTFIRTIPPSFKMPPYWPYILTVLCIYQIYYSKPIVL